MRLLSRMVIHGACHCGNITFELTWDPEPATIAGRACSCTFCTKHGGVWTANAASTLTVAIARPEHVARYEHGTRTAQFYVCSGCGVVPLVTSTIDGHLYAVVNVNTFDDAARARVAPAAVSFDGEPEATRLARRKRGWIADVRID
jgi:hypothetical protein